ncbi:putative sphinganine-1-phosphate aldolase [Helianthus annuus]|nr:putative sphinganine-1-phosphate aldolase [Helianthus annuus]KAJ0900067.1 putative sphinganine-1-phosphate aldolase [Helianthus annuus]
MEASKRIQQGVKEIPELFIVGRPDMTIVAFGSNVIDIFEVNDILSSKGWHLSPLQRPNRYMIIIILFREIIIGKLHFERIVHISAFISV